jgi:hypothetical protein
MSTWRSLEDLHRFVNEGLHGGALKQRHEWFEPIPVRQAIRFLSTERTS